MQYLFFRVMTSQTCPYKRGAFVDFLSAVTQTFKNLFLNVLLDRYLFYHVWQISSPHGFLLLEQFSVCPSVLCVYEHSDLCCLVVYFLLMGQKPTVWGNAGTAEMC